MYLFLTFVLSSEQRNSGIEKFSQEAHSCPLIMKSEVAGKTRHVGQEFLCSYGRGWQSVAAICVQWILFQARRLSKAIRGRDLPNAYDSIVEKSPFHQLRPEPPNFSVGEIACLRQLAQRHLHQGVLRVASCKPMPWYPS